MKRPSGALSKGSDSRSSVVYSAAGGPTHSAPLPVLWTAQLVALSKAQLRFRQKVQTNDDLMLVGIEEGRLIALLTAQKTAQLMAAPHAA